MLGHPRFLVVLVVAAVFVGVLHGERARGDDLQGVDDSEQDDVVETIKRFLGKKKTTTAKPSSDAISALLTTTKASALSTSTKSSFFGSNDRSSTRSSLFSSTSRFGGSGRATTAATKDACGVVSPCKNGGTCKTLSSGRFYCFCPQDYYGKNCESKFITSGAANNDRARKDHCADQPCRNGGECVGLRTTFYCRCKSPFFGIKCDKRLNKREEIVDEAAMHGEDDANTFERDLQEDNEELRRAIGGESDAADAE